jgi:tRNA pseudouridine-54 N-methylase
VFVVGDPQGFDADTRARLSARGARRLSLGPVQVHGEDALTLVHNELDRRAARAQPF